MAQVTVTIGAPSLAGKDCTEDVKKAFEKSSYPLTVKVKNLMPRDACFPEVDGLFMMHVANPEKSEKTVEIKDYDLFARLASSASQIAENNDFNPAVQFTAEGTEIDDGDDEEEEALVGKAKVGESVTAAASVKTTRVAKKK